MANEQTLLKKVDGIADVLASAGVILIISLNLHTSFF